MTSPRSPRIEAFGEAMSEASQHLAVGNLTEAFSALERAHVLGQVAIVPHLRVHWQMLRVGWRMRNGREVVGQLIRLVLVPVGHLAGGLPVGNTGGANVSAFQPMVIPPEIERLMNDRDR